MQSPWGKIDRVEKITTGVSFVSTPRHGGLRVSRLTLFKYAINPDLILKLGGTDSGNYVFFEEDCAYALFLFDAPEILKIDAMRQGKSPDELFEILKKIVERWYPEYFESVK